MGKPDLRRQGRPLCECGLNPLAIALAAIGGLVLLNVLSFWMFGKSQKLCGALAAENKALRVGAEVHARADRILAESVASGGRLRARLLARAERGLPESDSHGGTSATTGSKSTGGH